MGRAQVYNFEREKTINQLKKVGIVYDILIMGIGGGQRIVINDLKPNSKLETAGHICIERNEGIENIKI